MFLRVSDIKTYMEKWAPLKFAEAWDNPGMSVGNPNCEVKKILVALDAQESVIDEAIEIGANLIVTHHPFIFSGIKNIDMSTPMGRKIFKLIKNDISIYSAHTNLDVAKGGTNDVLADICELKNVQILDTVFVEKLYKIVVYVPYDYIDSVREALFNVDAGHIGNYSSCSFSVNGEGTFKPLEGTNPFIGKEGLLEKASEYRLETVVKEDNLQKTIDAILKAHPYEEVAYDIFLLEQKGASEGIGRFGELLKPISLKELALKLKEALGLDYIRIVGDENKIIKKVSLCTGSGMSYLNKAKRYNSDLYISSDIKYHEAQNAEDMGLCLIDVTHYAGENIIVPVIKEYLDNIIKENGYECDVEISNINGQPFINI